MYPIKLQTFLKSSPSWSTMFNKALNFPDRFKNTIEKYKELFNEFHSISFGYDLTYSEKLNWIKNDIYDQPVCTSCGTKLEISKDSGKYAEYCNNKCYFNNLSKVNPYAKEIVIEGVDYPSTNAACDKLKLSYYNLKIMLYDKDIENCYYKHNHVENIELDLGGKNLLLLNYEWLTQKKLDYVTMFELCNELDVKLDVLRLAFYYHGISTTYDQIPRESQVLLKDKNWISAKILEKRAHEIAAELSCSPSTILNTCSKFGIEIPSLPGSVGEEEVAEFVKDLGFEIIQRTRKKIHPYEIDIYIPSINVGIEFNGVWYHREDEESHFRKYKLCKEQNIRLIQIFEDDWAFNRELIKSKLKNILGVSTEDRVFARKCLLSKVESSEARKFYENNHIYGHRNCKNHFGLWHDDVLVAMMSFHQNKLERYATSKIVVGGFSKLLKYCISELNLTFVITFADLCWSSETDNVYVKNGFEVAHITSPNYFWVVNSKRCSRLKYQKHKLKTLPTYDDKKSERDIMSEMGYYRIFDAGHVKLVLTLPK